MISENSQVLVYVKIKLINNILIYSQSKEEHLEHLRQLFLTLREVKLYLNLKKCSFMQPCVLFLGFIVSKHDISTDLKKVRVIREWPKPKSTTETRSFCHAPTPA